MISRVLRRELADMVTAPRTGAPWRPVGWVDPQVPLADLERVLKGLISLDQGNQTSAKRVDGPQRGHGN